MWYRSRPQIATRTRRSRRPIVESLEGRVVLSSNLPNIAVLSTTAQDAHTVSVTYQIQNAPVSKPFQIAIGRSDSSAVDASTIQVGTVSASGSNLSVGTHTLTVAVPTGLVIDPSHPFVIAQANPRHAIAESNFSDNSASFRIYIIGAVTHGYEPALPTPQWVTTAANDLKADGYDETIAFGWGTTAMLPTTGLAIAAGQKLANEIDADVMQLPAGAVIDLHLIAHSRGSVVIDQAILDLTAMEKSGSHPELNGLKTGFTEMTFLDPHPATPTIGGVSNPYYSASTGAFGELALRGFNKTQAAMNDPDIVIPPGVSLVQEFYQHSAVTNTPNTYLSERFFNIWGETAFAGVNQYYDVTALTGGHRQVFEWYMQNVIPLLKTANPTIPGVSPTSKPTAPPRPSTTGASYEIGVLETVTDSAALAQKLDSMMATTYSAFAGGHPLMGSADLAAFTAYVQLERTQGHITADGADQLTQVAAFLLVINA